MLQISARDAQLFTDFATGLTPLEGTDHLEGCACAACAQAAADGGDKAPGPGTTNAADTVPGNTSSTATVPVGGFVQGAIDTGGDHDWYQVSLVAGQTYTIYTILPGSGLPDSVITLRDSAGNLIVENDDAASSPNHYTFSELTFTATSTGTYFIDVSGYDAVADTGDFYLTVSAPTADAVAGSAATTASLTLGVTTSGTFDANGDHDWYAVTLTAGQSYVFNTSATGGAGDPDTTLVLRNASGALISYNDDSSGTYSQIRFTPTASGTYYLDVAAWGNAETGAYRITADLAPPKPVYTNDEIAYQLTNTYWGGTARHWNVGPGGTITVNITALTADGQTLAREALNLWTDATGINFNEVATGGQIVFDDNQSGAFASSTRVGSIITGANVNVSETWLTSSGNTVRSYTFQAYVHEIGHALGLGHAGPYNGNADYAADSTYQNDSWATTIMSYFDQAENTYFAGLGFSRQIVVTPMIADLIAVQNLYGVNTLTRTGDTVYGVNSNAERNAFIFSLGQASVGYVIVDNGGNDTMDYSISNANQRIDLNAEAFSNIGGGTGNVSIARGTVIENAVGGNGNDTIIGNSVANSLSGGAGNDTLYGGLGNDTLNGGSGVNVLYGEGGDDLLVFTGGVDGSTYDGGTGSDTLVIAATTAFGTNTVTAMERLEVQSGATFTLTGTQLNAILPGGAIVSGSGGIVVNMVAGAALLTKSFNFTGFTGTFTANGTAGNDVMKLGNAANTIAAGDGFNRVQGGSLVDTYTGGSGIDKIAGNGGADVLTGGGGADVFKFRAITDSGLGALADRITDFAIGVDRLNFSRLDADANTAGDQAFAFLGTAAFANTGLGQIRYQNSGSDLLVEVDVNGDGVADMQVVLQGLNGSTLTGTDFVL